MSDDPFGLGATEAVPIAPDSGTVTAPQAVAMPAGAGQHVAVAAQPVQLPPGQPVPIAAADDAPIFGDDRVPAAWGSRILTWIVPFALVGLGLLAAATMRDGAVAFLDSTGGQVQDVVTDPLAPGYEALVDPTPVMLLLLPDPEDELATFAIVSLAADESGGTVLTLPSMVRYDESASTVADAYGANGAEGARRAVAEMVNLNFETVEVIDADRWSTVLDNLGPIPITITEDLVTRDEVGTASVVFAAGSGAIDPEFVSLFVGWRNPDENVFNQLSRLGLFWDALFDVLAEEPDLIPGEGDVGLSRYLRSVTSGPFRMETVQLEADGPLIGDVAFVPEPAELEALMAEMVPFPIPAEPGARPRVRLLDGVGDREALLERAGQLVAAGAQITVLGNAATFDDSNTRIVVHTSDGETDARRFVTALGADVDIESEIPELPTPEAGGEVEVPETIFDVTVVIGVDLAEEVAE